MEFDPVTSYPLGSRRPDLVETRSGASFESLTFAAAREGTLAPDDLRATSGTLLRQAEIARASGRSQLAENLARASELVDVPDDELLAIYTALRPGRSTVAELEAAAVLLDGHGATRTAAFVREAAAAYAERDLLRA
jgi:propanediol dehydratase small subunit